MFIGTPKSLPDSGSFIKINVSSQSDNQLWQKLISSNPKNQEMDLDALRIFPWLWRRLFQHTDHLADRHHLHRRLKLHLVGLRSVQGKFLQAPEAQARLTSRWTASTGPDQPPFSLINNLTLSAPVHPIDRRLHLVLLLQQADPHEHPPHHSSHFQRARLGLVRVGRSVREARERLMRKIRKLRTETAQ